MLKKILTTTILTGSLAFGGMAYAESNAAITSETVQTAARDTGRAIKDPRLAAERFIEHVNYARVAIALKDSAMAKQHIAEAREMVAVLKNIKVEERRITKIQSGRIVYEYETNVKNHYFPIEKLDAGPVEVKKVDNGPVWANAKGIAVTDAEMVYLSLDLSNDKAEKGLEDAWIELERNDASKAQYALEKMIGTIVSVDTTIDLPLDKAIDNIALTRSFIAAKNYDGARFSLKHADKALETLEKDARYSARKNAMTTYRKEVADLQNTLKSKDPTVFEKADITLDKWWVGIKSLVN